MEIRYLRATEGRHTNVLKTMGFDEAFLWVLEDNRGARRFYEKFGFAQSDCNMEIYIGGKRLKQLKQLQYIKEI